MDPYVLMFSEVGADSMALVGGKGANLGEMARAGFPVPPGFCVTTQAYREFVAASPELDGLLDALEGTDPDDLSRMGGLGKRIRDHLTTLPVPDAVRASVLSAWRETGPERAYAVRSSATAEDLPTASFAGQQDTYLNVQGEGHLLDAVRRCWASLFTDRAIAYRATNGFPHRSVLLSVVVQRMILPEVSGIMFTADPITGRRKTVSIDASFGIGEALVSGLVTADLYQVRSGAIVTKRIARKALAVRGLPDGGTAAEEVPASDQERQALPDELILELAALGSRIEGHFGRPQDIEWCRSGGAFYVVQSRPITTFYPPPKARDGRLHLYVSFGHVQMMTEPMKPLGVSALRTFFPVGDWTPAGESEIVQEAGCRLFVDLNPILSYGRLRHVVPWVLTNVDEKAARAVAAFLKRPDYREALGPGRRVSLRTIRPVAPVVAEILAAFLYRDFSGGIARVEQAMAESVARWQKALEEASGPERIARIRGMLRSLFPDVLRMKILQNVAPGILAFRLIEALSTRWLGDAAELGDLAKAPRGNVTTEMGLALGDLADVVRAHPGAIERLRAADDTTLLSSLDGVPGVAEVNQAIETFLERYGMRGTGEIDLTRPRWGEAPTQLVPAIESYMKSGSPGEHRRAFLAGEGRAVRAAVTLLERLKGTRVGWLKRRVMRRLINVYRSRIGLREHPKFYVVQLFDLAKRGILREARGLTGAGILSSPDDVFWLSLSEIEETLRTRRVDRHLLDERRDRFARDRSLRPPRLITSEGEVVEAPPGEGVPAGALAGTAASAGVVEGRARVVCKLEEARIEKGDILIAPYTDPAWTPLFPIAAGLVTEVGGLMTHGAVVAREYGIPAVVGVDGATEAIKDGALVRVNGTQGYVEVLGDETTKRGEWAVSSATAPSSQCLFRPPQTQRSPT
jgi:pyruvate,water dikinase